LRAEGFSCSLGVLYEGLRISKLQFFIPKKIDFFQLHFFPKIFLDPDPDSLEMLDPDPDPNESGSTTMVVELKIGDQPFVMLIHVHCSGTIRQISCETSLIDTETLFFVQRSFGPHR
jgi:hypothetical protein